MSRNCNIVYYTSVDLSKKNGQSIYAFKVLRSILEKKVSVHLICPKISNREVIDSLIRDFQDNLTFDTIGTQRQRKNLLWHLLYQLLSIFYLSKLRNKDAIVFSLKPYSFAPLIYSTLFKVPIFLLVEGRVDLNLDQLLRSELQKKISSSLLDSLIKKADYIYPAYKRAQEWVDAKSPVQKKSKIITCCADTRIFKPRKQKTQYLEKLTIGYVGSFRKDHLLKELILATQNLDLVLKLVGKGDQEEDLKNLVRDRADSLDLQVIFMGEKDQTELPNFFAECHLMWGVSDPSHWSVPIKCFEYLACNKKIIYSYRNEFNFVKENNFGYCLESGTVLEIQQLILEIKKQFDQGENFIINNENSSNYIQENHDWKIYGDIIIGDILFLKTS